MRAHFVRGAEKPTDLGIGKYKEMQGLPEEIQKTIITLRDIGYWDPQYDEGMKYRYENERGGSHQFFWDYKNDKYTYQGAKIEWGSLFWLPLKSPEFFYDKVRERDDIYIGEDELTFEGSLQVSKIDPNSDVAKHYGGSILVEIGLKIHAHDSLKELSNLPESYDKKGIKDVEELVKFITKKIRDLEIYIKKFLTRYHKINESLDFERGVDPKGSMNVGLKSVIYNKLKSFFNQEIILSGRRGMASFFSFFPDLKGNYCFEAPVTQKWMESILKEYGFDEYLEFPGESIERKKNPRIYTVSYKIKEPFIQFFNNVTAKDFLSKNESINFERGIDPMDSMKLGQYHERQLEKARKELKIIFDDIQQRYGGKVRVYKSISTLGTGMQATWIPPSAPYNYGIQFDKEDEEYYYKPYKWNKPGEPFVNQFYGGRKSAREAANEMIAQWGGQQLVDQWGKTNEAVNFERGMEPKRAMKVGQHRNDLFNEIKSMPFVDAMKTFSQLGSNNDRKILSLAANMLGVPEKEVRIAMDRDEPVYNDNPLMDEFISREWQYGKEDYLESGSMIFDLIGSSTGEIYVKDRRTDEFLYVLGAIN